ncbi:MAG: SH3 domain-containing protein [Lachnospiraceae bacterium]|nr:SH3 domain-containing protein [Lachnospiraceae bacterium]
MGKKKKGKKSAALPVAENSNVTEVVSAESVSETEETTATETTETTVTEPEETSVREAEETAQVAVTAEAEDNAEPSEPMEMEQESLEEADDSEFVEIEVDAMTGEILSEKETIFEREQLKHVENKDGEFFEFMSEVWQKLSKWCKKNKKVLSIGAGVVAGAVLIGVLVFALTDGKSPATSVSGNGLSANTVSESAVLSVPTDPLQENAYPEVNDLVNRYFLAMQTNDIETLRSMRSYIDTVEEVKIEVKSTYVEEYQNIVCYTKAGPFENSYIVYVCYDVKLVGWEQVAPSLLTLFVCENESGELYVYSGDFDENVADYIVAVTSQQDVKDLLTRVDTEYTEVMDANAEFATYMNALNQVIRDEVGERLAAEAYQMSDETVSENEVADADSVSDNEVAEAEPEEEAGPFEVEATTTVNVRASDSEEADRLGRVEGGTVLQCNAQLANGWSEVVYEGEIGYIKSEYLQVVGEPLTESADGVETIGTVTVTDTVNIRATADLDGERVGVAYQGETFDVIDDSDDEWIEIVYNGQIAYVNSDYVE